MPFDLATALAVTALLTFAIGISLLFAASRYPPALRSTLKIWTGGLFLQGLAFLAPAFLGVSATASLILPINVTYALAYAEMGRAVNLFVNRRNGYLPILLVAVVAINSLVLGVLWPSERWRLIINAVPIATLQFRVARSILQERAALRPADYLTGALFLACAGLAIARAAVYLIPQADVAWLSNVVFVFGSILPTIGTIGFMLMCGDRLNDHLRQLAMVDPLTGIYNRRTLAGLAESAIGDAMRADRPLSLLAIDVDYFKRVNDEWGHDCGDEALCGLVARIKEALDPDQVLCRIGGEEFAVLLPGLDEVNACRIAERVRQHIAATPLIIDGHALALRVSIGVAALDSRLLDLPTLLREADRALYSAKREGRDRVAAATSLASHNLPLPLHI